MTRFIDAPAECRCMAGIRLSDGSTAQCGRRKQDARLLCWQHARKADSEFRRMQEIGNAHFRVPEGRAV